MSTAKEHAVIERIHAAGRECVVALTGGGSRAIADLLAVPGASASVLEAIVPYAATSLAEWLGGKFDQACSDRTARAMAMAAFERARKLSESDSEKLRGIGTTASLATNRPKRGPHRIHVGWQSAEATVSYSCELVKGRRIRVEEEAVATDLVLHVIAEACGVADEAAAEPSVDEPIVRREQQASREWQELLLGKRQSVEYRIAAAPKLVFSGAFNPPHEGHRRIIKVAADRCNSEVAMELSIVNVDKPTLDFIEIADRLENFGSAPVLLTRAPTFVEKAALVPGSTFVVGADTIARIADEKYYDGNLDKRDSAIAAIASRGCRFLVFGRAVEGRFILPSDLNLPRQLRELCDEVRESEFRCDVSSTELRTAAE